ncbi:hypothetical protein [Pigmentiphaga litoralis]|uniref:Lysozyme inhibitor LprI N-terminal domain-containing protein n=1 Tax=Pigmentiphaga litoralis TaxID=516702 RepID=A0A7Y9IRV7_9BURK|nr:hypothetical protein [Pigmentiphaga litoralis]NYE24528.1 hypothetical protein [Pigmentiphaga litoralis]NYE81858.1 hypothetical protein [Pigmentiphaga litoralis]
MSKLLVVFCFLLTALSYLRDVHSQPCPIFNSSPQALRYLRENQQIYPRTTAECFDRALVTPPSLGTAIDAETWRTYLWEGAQLLHRMADSSDFGPTARREYKNSELKTLALYRDKTLDRLRAESTKKNPLGVEALQTDYAKGVDAESNVFWQLSLQETKGLLNLQNFLSNLDPAHLLDLTAVRWLEAVRTCPNWVPAAVKPLPDYTNGWCKADCREHFTTVADKLNVWMSNIPERETLQSYRALKKRAIETKKFCKNGE